MKQRIVKQVTDRDWSRAFMDESNFDELIDESVILKRENGEPLAVLIKNAIHPEIGGYAWSALKKINLKSRNRGTAAGKAGEVFEGETREGKVRTGKTLQSAKGWDVVSGIVGYFERTVRMPWCRACAWNKDNPEEFEKLGTILRVCSEHFKNFVPDRYAAQKAMCDKTHPDFVIPGTVYTTLTVNKTFRTAAHLDVGDLAEGFSNMFVIKQGAVKGGHLVLPNFRIAFKLDNLDLILFDAHEWHGNTSIVTGKDGVRCSVVCYYRSKMVECSSFKKEFLRVKNRKRGEKLFESE